MLDIHAHLHDIAFDADRDAVVARALDTGVTKIITIGTDVMESRKAVACAEKHENVFASVGIHPNSFHEMKKEFSIFDFQFSIKSQFLNLKIQKNHIEQLKELAKHEKVVAIGECGLDYFVREEQGRVRTADAPPAGGTTAVSEEQRALQKAGFLVQIELGQELNLPLIIHCRPSKGTMDAYEDLFSILSNQNSRFQIPDSKFILHCYMGDTEVTRKFLELPNVYFSFTGNITYPVKKVFAGTKNDLTETVRLIPIERILAETDCPYLAPVPHRGKRNEPAFVTEVVAKIAETKGISRETVEQMISASAKMIFGI
jgi:TatD DNase family protein